MLFLLAIFFFPWSLFHLYFSFLFKPPPSALDKNCLMWAPFTVELGKETKMLFLACKALKARLDEQHYYGCVVLFFILGFVCLFFFLFREKKKKKKSKWSSVSRQNIHLREKTASVNVMTRKGSRHRVLHRLFFARCSTVRGH